MSHAEEPVHQISEVRWHQLISIDRLHTTSMTALQMSIASIALLQAVSRNLGPNPHFCSLSADCKELDALDLHMAVSQVCSAPADPAHPYHSRLEQGGAAAALQALKMDTTSAIVPAPKSAFGVER